MYWLSKTFHRIRRFRRRLLIFLSVLGPGIIVMIADNDAGGISTYAVTGSRYGFSLLWVFLILLPMAYYVQEMTVRVGAVTKRGQTEVIFEGFGPFWGCFSMVDLIIINWLTLITEYVGMTAAMVLSHLPPHAPHVRGSGPHTRRTARYDHHVRSGRGSHPASRLIDFPPAHPERRILIPRSWVFLSSTAGESPPSSSPGRR